MTGAAYERIENFAKSESTILRQLAGHSRIRPVCPSLYKSQHDSQSLQRARNCALFISSLALRVVICKRKLNCSIMAAAKLKGLTISVIPGTGNIGGALVNRLASAGFSVILGSRDAAKAKAAAAEVSDAVKKPVKGLALHEAAAAGDVIIWTVSGTLAEREALLKSLAKPLEGKIIVDTTNILYLLDESAWGQVSSTLLSQEALGVPARWTTAFKHVFAGLILDPPPVSNPHAVFVAGDDEEAVDITIALVDSIPGFKGARAGPLKYTKIVELLGPNWLPLIDRLHPGKAYRTGWRFGE